MRGKLIEVTKTSKRGSSLRMTPPKEIAGKLNATESEHIGFYGVNGEIVVRKIEWLYQLNEFLDLYIVIIFGSSQFHVGNFLCFSLTMKYKISVG